MAKYQVAVTTIKTGHKSFFLTNTKKDADVFAKYYRGKNSPKNKVYKVLIQKL